MLGKSTLPVSVASRQLRAHILFVKDSDSWLIHSLSRSHNINPCLWPNNSVMTNLVRGYVESRPSQFSKPTRRILGRRVCLAQAPRCDALQTVCYHEPFCPDRLFDSSHPRPTRVCRTSVVVVSCEGNSNFVLCSIPASNHSLSHEFNQSTRYDDDCHEHQNGNSG